MSTAGRVREIFADMVRFPVCLRLTSMRLHGRRGRQHQAARQPTDSQRFRSLVVGWILAALAVLSPAPATPLDTLPPVIVGTPTVQPSTIDVSDGAKSVRVEAHLVDPDGVFYVLFGFVHEEEPEVVLEIAGAHLVNGTPQDGVWQGTS